MGSNRVTVGSQLPAGTNNIGDVDVLTLPAIPAGTNNIGDVDVLTLPGVTGNVAHDAADSGNPVKVGGVAIDIEALPADVAPGDRVQAAYTSKGFAAVALFNPVSSAPLELIPVSVTEIADVVLAAGDNNIGNVDVVSSVLPTGAALESTLADVQADTLAIRTAVETIDNAIAGSEMQVDVVTLPAITGTVTANAGTNLNTSALGLETTQAAANVLTGAVAETAPASDTASSGLNGRLQRIAQRLSSLIAVFNIGAGTEAAAVRVTLPTDGTGKVNAAQSGTWNVGTVTTVTAVTAITNALPAGTNAIGKLSANSGVDIGDVDVTSLPALAAGTNNIGDVDVLTLPGVAGDVAHDAVDSGNPLKIGGKASTSPPTAVAVNDRVNAWLDTFGTQQVTLRDTAGAALVTGTQYVEDAALAADAAQGTLVVARRDDALSTLTPAENDAVGLRVNSQGALWAALGAALPAGTANIGDVDVLTLPALPAGTNNIGDVDVASIAAGDNNIGNVDVVTLPALVAGSANIGDVDVLTVPADPFGANADAVVAAGAVGSIQAKLRRLTTDIDAIKTSVAAATPAGSNNIGDVDVLTLPALVAGTANIGDVDVLTLPNVTLAAGTNTNEVVGDVAEDVALAGNPVRQGVRASTAVPTAMSADNDLVTPWANRNGAQVVVTAPHVGLNSDPWNLVHEAAQYTTAQTSTVLVAGGASEKLVVTKVQIQVGGTVAGTLQLYFGTGAFSRGTSRAIFDGEFAPSATSKPGVVMDGPFIAGTNGDDLMVTGVGAINPLTINVWYYVVT